jgi:hypothetical protein
MALSAASVFEVRTAGADTNGGGFVTGASGTDFSQQNSKNTTGSNISTTDAVGAGTTTLTSITGNFSTAIVGNIIYLQGGTGSLAAGWYQVTARASTTSITLDRAVAVGTGITMNIGGALLSPAIASSIATVGGMIIYLQNGGSVFSITTATTNVAGGAITNSSVVSFVGYATNRTFSNTDSPPTIQTNVSTATQVTGSGCVYRNIIFDGNTQTASRHTASTGANFIICMIMNFNTVSAATSPAYISCSATSNSAAVFQGSCIYCEAYANSATPFNCTVGYGCLSYGNTVASVGFTGANTNQFLNCVAYGNAGAGFGFNGGTVSTLINCHAEANTGFGFLFANGTKVSINNSAFNNTAGNVSATAITMTSGFITLTSTAFTNAAGNVFNLNTTAGGGASLRAAGFPSVFPRGLTSNFRDIGAAQHQDPTGSAGGSFTFVS